MKTFITLLLSLSFLLATEESKQLAALHPLQDAYQSNRLMCKMQSDLMTYLYETPLSSYAYFNTHKHTLESDALTTWVHGEAYIHTLTAHKAPLHAGFKDDYKIHMGDYRYDIFTLLSDLLLKMQNESDFSGSKEKAILGTLVDSYFEKIKNLQSPCPCSDEALSHVNESDLLSQYTTLRKGQRFLNFQLDDLSQPSVSQTREITETISRHALQKGLDPVLQIKSIAVDRFGNYLLLCEGKSTDIRDDMLFTLNADTLPASYLVDPDLKRKFKAVSLSKRLQARSVFTPDECTGVIRIGSQNFILSRLNPGLQIKPGSEKTGAYKHYASALGFMLASLHANVQLENCRTFRARVNKEVKLRQFKIEMIEMVYAYNEQLERQWEGFGERYASLCKSQLLSDRR